MLPGKSPDKRKRSIRSPEQSSSPSNQPPTAKVPKELGVSETPIPQSSAPTSPLRVDHSEPASKPPVNSSAHADKKEKARGKLSKATASKKKNKSKVKTKLLPASKTSGHSPSPDPAPTVNTQPSGEPPSTLEQLPPSPTTQDSCPPSMSIASEDVHKDSRSSQSPRVAPRPILKTSATYAAAVQRNPGPILSQFRPYRVIVQFEIKKPGNKAKRTEMISKRLNEFLAAAKEVNYKQRCVYVRKYKEHHEPNDYEKPSWIKEFNPKLITSLTHYTHGFYPSAELKERTFRLNLQLMVPVNLDLSTFVENVDGLFNTKDDRRVHHCQDQNLYDPKPVGWLLRSNWHMAASDDLIKDLESRLHAKDPSISLGLSYKSVTPPGKFVYDKETSVRALVVSTNAEHVHSVTEFFFSIYNVPNATFPLGFSMSFVPHKDHPDIKNNHTAALNLSTLLERQKIFTNMTKTIQCEGLADIYRTTHDNTCLRDTLLAVRSVHKNDQESDGQQGFLFHAVMSRTFPNGDIAFYLTFHNHLELEARSVIANMGVFLRDELGLDPELYCHPISIKDDHVWDPKKRVCYNPTTSHLDFLVKQTGGLMVGPDEEVQSMTSKEYREYRRTVGIDDTETVQDIQAPRRPRSSNAPPPEVGMNDNKSVMSGLTNYSSESKASQHRKDLRAQVHSQQEALADKEAALEAALVRIKALEAGQHSNSPPIDLADRDSDPDWDQSPSPSADMDESTYTDQHDDAVVYADANRMFPLDNPHGDPSISPEPTWLHRDTGPQEDILSLAVKFHNAGYVVILSRTRAGENEYSLFTEGDDSFEDALESGQGGDEHGSTADSPASIPLPPSPSDPLHDQQSVKFKMYKQVQYYERDSTKLMGDDEEQSMDMDEDTPMVQETASKVSSSLRHNNQDNGHDNDNSSHSLSSSDDSSGEESSEIASSSSSSSSSPLSQASGTSSDEQSRDDDSGISYDSPPKQTLRKPNITAATLTNTKAEIEKFHTDATGGSPGRHG